MTANLDHCELHVDILSYAAATPYIDSSSGLTTRDLKFESCEVVDTMYEAKVSDVGTAKIVMPSLIASPQIRGVLSQIKEGDRVEIYNFQPSCGDPIFAGYIPPNGLTEADGKLTIAVHDPLEQGRWQSVRRFETFQLSAAQLINRGMQHWVDIVNDNFASAMGSSASYATAMSPPSSMVPVWAEGDMRINQLAGGSPFSAQVQVANQNAKVVPAVGDTYVIEVDYSVFVASDPGGTKSNLGIGFVTDLSSAQVNSATITLGAYIANLANGGAGPGAPPVPAGFGYAAWVYAGNFGDYRTTLPTFGQTTNQTAQVDQNDTIHHMMFVVSFNSATNISMSLFRDGVYAASLSPSASDYATASDSHFVGATLYPALQYYVQSDNGAAQHANFYNLRVRKLQNYIAQDHRFNATTADSLYYQPNNEKCLDFMNLFVQTDGDEYRVNYRAAPTQDTLELDQVGTLGTDVSATLGYSQDGNNPVFASPAPASAEQADFLIAPPFRFEEGHNLVAPPKKNAKANPHANEIIRMGSNTTDAQSFADIYGPAEVGNPALPNNSTYLKTYPYFEQLTNDDRVGLTAVNVSLAQLDLARALDTTPSLEVEVVTGVEYTGRYRAGDDVWVKTLSLVSNVETSMRIAAVTHLAGSPSKRVVLGKVQHDSTMLRMMAEDTVRSWLYNQTGTGLATYIYPSVPVTLSGSPSTAFTFTLDQYTTGTQITEAWIHWFTNAAPSSTATALLNSMPITSSSGTTDSGLMNITGLLPQPGQYTLAFTGSGIVNSAYIVIRVKI